MGRMQWKAEKILLKALVCVLGAVILVAGYTQNTQAAAQQKELKWATFLPKGSARVMGLEPFKWAIEKFSGGAIKLKLYYSGEIAETKDLPDLCRTGTIDMISIAPNYHSKLFPLAAALQDFPVLIPIEEIEEELWMTMMAEIPEMTEEWSAQNMKLLARALGGNYYTISKKPIRRMDDLKGMKIRISGGRYTAELNKAGGAISVHVSSPEIYEALMRGTVDAVQYGLSSHYSYKFWEIAKYMGYPMGCIVLFANVINLDTWKSLTPEMQHALNEAALYYIQKDAQLFYKERAEATDLLKSKGVQFIDFPKKDWERILKTAGDPWEALRKDMKGVNKADAGEKMIRIWKRVLSKYGNQELTE